MPGKRISANAPCPCGSRRKYKKCCMPPREGGPGLSSKGLAAGMVEFAQPLLDEAEDEAAMDGALNLAMLFWNVAVGGREFALEQLPELERKGFKSDDDRMHFRSIARTMLKRYDDMRPGAQERLGAVPEELWGPDLTSGLGRPGLLRRALDALSWRKSE